jgi:predicted branched-subunit amino acid permease
MTKASAPRSFRDGVRAGIPFAVAGGTFALTFGVAARPVLGAIPAVVMSMLVFGGASQFGALSVLAAGGGPIAAIVVGTLINIRFLPMSIALAPSLRHRWYERVARGQAIIDPSWVMARRADGHYDSDFLIGASAAQYCTWVGGTALGVTIGPLLGDTTRTLGLDAVFPAFMLGLLAMELRRPGARLVAAGGAFIAVVLTPALPAGLPIIAATAATALGTRAAR